jgi:HSP20 family molecular chaperone IbpA
MELKNLLTPWNWFKKEEEQQVVRPQISGRNSGSSHPLMRLHNEIDQIFDQFYHGFPLFPLRWPQERSKGGVIFPQLNIVENKNAYTITVDVPGVEEKDIELTVQEGTLTIRGEKQTEKEDNYGDQKYENDFIGEKNCYHLTPIGWRAIYVVRTFQKFLEDTKRRIPGFLRCELLDRRNDIRRRIGT